MPRLSIGKMAEMNNVSVQALRLYDSMGLLTPAYINDQTGYRYYDIKQCATLDMINYMKSSGLTLKEIKTLFDTCDLNALSIVLKQHLDQIDKEIETLNLQKKAITKMIDSYHRYLNSPGDGMITLEYIEDRKIYAYPSDINFYDYEIDIYENSLKNLKKQMHRNGINDVYYYNVGSTIKMNDFLKQKIISSDIFVFVDADCPSPLVEVLPARMYVCMYCDDFDKEQRYIPMLYHYIEEHHLTICGDYICEVLTELPMVDKGKRDMFLRLQVPVNFVKK